MTSIRKLKGVNRKKRYLSIILLIFLGCMALSYLVISPVETEARPTEPQPSKPKVLMILLSRISVEDIVGGEYQNINRLLSMGSLGLMTVNTAGGYTDANAYVTMGAGDRLLGDPRTGEAYNRDERLGDGSRGIDLYERNTGSSPGQAQVLSTTVFSTTDANKDKYTFALPGQLGSILHQHGLKTALVGNSDLGQEDPPNRLAAAVAMDASGKIDMGDVSKSLLQKDLTYPYGWRTDYQKVTAALGQIWQNSDFIVVETGDSIRANASGPQQLKKMKEYHRKNAIKQADVFIGQILPKIGKDVMVVLAAPLPPDSLLREGIRLAPVIMAGGGYQEAGILASSSTRQPGLIANYDLSATIAHHLGIRKAEELVGLPVMSQKTADSNVANITSLYHELNMNTQLRNTVLFYFTRIQWLIFAVIFLLILFDGLTKIPVGTSEKRIMKTLLLLPLIILLVGSIPLINVYLSLGVTAFLTVISYLMCGRIKKDNLFYMTTALAGITLCVGDVLLGGNLMKNAALSYDMVAGGRFYGIGNEYMGVLIGLAILGFSAWLQHKPELKNKIFLSAILVFSMLVIFLAAPYAGTNAGGTLAAVIGFVSLIYLFTGKKITLKTSLLTTAAMVAGFGMLFVMNSVLSVNVSSHIGRSIDFLILGDLNLIWQTMMRKLEANLYLLRNSPFSVVLIMQVLILIGLVVKENKRLLHWAKKEYYLSMGFIAMVISSLAAFTLNDSGVIASAMMNNYLIIPLLMKMREYSQDIADMKVGSRVGEYR